MKNQKLISKFNRTNRVLSIIVLFVLIGLVIGCFYNYDSKDVTTTFYLIGSLFFLAFVLLIIREIYNSPTLIINSDQLKLVRIFNIKTEIIELQNIQSWLNRKKKHKYGDYEILYLVLSDLNRLKIKSYNYSNFDQLEHYLTHKKSKNLELEKELNLKEKQQYFFAFILIGLIFLYISAKNYDYKQLSSSDISIVKGHLSEPLKIETGRRSSKTLIIKLNEFPEFNFRIGDMALRETYYQDLIKDFNEGEVLAFAIEKDVYDKKISKKIELTYWDMIFHYDKIHVVEIIDNNFKYLSLEDYNRVHHTNDKWFFGFFGVFGLLLIFGGIAIYKKDK
jgi:hypothetical protein